MEHALFEGRSNVPWRKGKQTRSAKKVHNDDRLDVPITVTLKKHLKVTRWFPKIAEGQPNFVRRM
jgi:hypothetical protein